MVLTILKNMKVNGKDYSQYIVEKSVWNKQPGYDIMNIVPRP